MDLLPDELVQGILLFLPVQDLLNFSCCCRYTCSLANSDHVWSHLCREEWAGKVGIRWEDGSFLWRKPGLWKTAYQRIRQESLRTQVKARDMYESTWIFKYSELVQIFSHSMPLLGYPVFRPDGVYTHNGPLDFYGPEDGERWSAPWRLTDTNAVQIATFQPLDATRLQETWGWQLQNPYGTFITLDHSGFRHVLLSLLKVAFEDDRPDTPTSTTSLSSTDTLVEHTAISSKEYDREYQHLCRSHVDPNLEKRYRSRWSDAWKRFYFIDEDLVASVWLGEGHWSDSDTDDEGRHAVW